MKRRDFILVWLGVAVIFGAMVLCYNHTRPTSVVSVGDGPADAGVYEHRQSATSSVYERPSEQDLNTVQASPSVTDVPQSVLIPNRYPGLATSRIDQARPEDLEQVYAFIQNPNPPAGMSRELADSVKDDLLRQLDDISPTGYLKFLESLLFTPPNVNDVMKHYALQHMSVTVQLHPEEPHIEQGVRSLLLHTIESQSQTAIGGTALLALKRLAGEDEYEELAAYAHIYLNGRHTHPSSRSAAYAVMGELQRTDAIHQARIDASQSLSLMLQLASTHYLSTMQHGETP